MKQYVIITRNKSWATGFVCQNAAADLVVKALNDSEGENGDWQVTSVPLTSEEAESTLMEWIEEGL